MMAELDRFEARFVTAYRRYLAEAPVEVDAVAIAREVAAAAPRRHALAGFRPFGLSPALAWTVLLAGLLVALVGGALLVGSRPPQELPAVVPPVGQVFECPPGSTPDKPGPVDQARPPGGPMVFDRASGRIVLVGRPDEGGAQTWTFDVCTNAWTRMHPDREHIISSLVYDIDSEMTIGSDVFGRVWAYDLRANTWTEKGRFDQLSIPPQFDQFRFYDPVSGLAVALAVAMDSSGVGTTGTWSYDIETDTWTSLVQDMPYMRSGSVVYDTSVDKMVAYFDVATGLRTPAPDGSSIFPSSKTWLFDLRTGASSPTGAASPEFFFGGWGNYPAIAYDEAAKRTVLLGQGHSAAYDATADRWETLSTWTTSEEWPTGVCGAHPECRQSPEMVYDPVNERLVVYGGDTLITGSDDVLAFDTRTRTWTVLLAATDGKPAP
jgi:hypothetical protein